MESPEKRLASYLDAHRPIIYINNFDFAAADDLILKAIDNNVDLISEYNNACGEVHPVTKMPLNGNEALLSSSSRLAEFLQTFITDMPLNRILVLKDVHTELEEPTIIAQLKAIALQTMNCEDFLAQIIIVSSKLVIPIELEKFVTVFDMPYPNHDEIEGILTDYAKDYSFTISAEDCYKLALSFKGLSKFEIIQILNLAYMESGSISLASQDLILREKEQSIRKSGLLEAIHVSSDKDDIGGLDNLVKYLEQKAYVYRHLAEAIKFGVDIPKGILIVGLPGCGKSLTAKVSAKLFNAPLLRLDVGKLLGKYIGESEDNLRRAIGVAEAATPCVLWIDELEKAFAGVGKDDGGGSVTTRLFGYFLTWLQEKDSTVYVVATANDIENIPPEFLRKGRFDEIFSVDLPDAEERKKIFEIHLSRRKRNWRSLGIKLNDLVRHTGGSSSRDFSGADIEAIVKTAIENAFVNQRELEQDDLIKAINETVPIAKTMSEKIAKLKESLKKYQITPASIGSSG